MSINRTITFLISEDVSASLDIDSVEIKRLRAIAEGVLKNIHISTTSDLPKKNGASLTL